MTGVGGRAATGADAQPAALPPKMTIIHLTDTHIRPAGQRVHGVVDSYAQLTAVLGNLRAARRPIDAIVLSGDLTDTGSPEAYRRLRDAVEPVAGDLGARTVYLMGNHDDRRAFRAALPVADADPADPDGPIDQVVELAGLRIIALDSTIPGAHDGALDDRQVRRLVELLREPAPRGTVLTLHHPPIPSPVAATDHLRLRDPAPLERAVAGSDVHLILCGHNHLTGVGALGGVPVWIGPALSYRIDPLAPVGRHRGTVGYGYSRVDLIGSTMVATAVEATPAATIYDRDERDVLAEIAAATTRPDR